VDGFGVSFFTCGIDELSPSLCAEPEKLITFGFATIGSS